MLQLFITSPCPLCLSSRYVSGRRDWPPEEEASVCPLQRLRPHLASQRQSGRKLQNHHDRKSVAKVNANRALKGYLCKDLIEMYSLQVMSFVSRLVSHVSVQISRLTKKSLSFLMNFPPLYITVKVKVS